MAPGKIWLGVVAKRCLQRLDSVLITVLTMPIRSIMTTEGVQDSDRSECTTQNFGMERF